ncbi:hypothetical protein VULLAG_LOCUS20768 [Vulpes lagopus]
MGVWGHLLLPWKCLVVVSLRLLFLVPTGVPVRSGDATFPKAMDNVTVRQGESATLRSRGCHLVLEVMHLQAACNTTAAGRAQGTVKPWRVLFAVSRPCAVLHSPPA